MTAVNGHPMQVTHFWVLLYADGRWWCEKPILDGDLAQRTADAWNSNLTRGERDRLRVAEVLVQEQP